MRSTYIAQPQNPAGFWLKHSTLHAMTHLLAAVIIVVLSVASFVVSTLFGVIATFSMTLLLCLMLPAATPALLIFAFMFQNMIIAFFVPLLDDGAGFDSIRGVNFVILLTALGAFGLSIFLHTDRLPLQTRYWLKITLGVMGLVALYMVLGAVRGDPKDALIYFRNTLTPLATFGIGLTVASVYTIHLRPILLWLGLAAAAYGYLELFFTVDFLALFNGDEYFNLRLAGQVESGHWDRVLEQTGFVLMGLEDIMRVPFLNMAVLDQWFPHVFRLSGPNIHPISYAYALSVISVWMLFSRRAWFLLLTIPLLIIIGSKGALILLLSAIAMKLGVRLIGLRPTVLAFILVLVAYISGAILYGRANGDYHVLGFLAGVRDFLKNPIGQGLGLGGNLSSSITNVLSWSRAQHLGVADIPVESAVGVMLYQMGVAAIVYFAMLLGVARTCYRAYEKTGAQIFLFGLTAITTIFANAVLQEEAIYSPLALGLTLLFVGISFGQYWREQDTQLLPIQTHPQLGVFQ